MKNIFKIFIFLFFCLTSSAIAANVDISSVTVNENGQGYSIVLNTNKQVKYKKINENLNSTYFEIKNVKAQDDIPVQYDNIKTIESVTIQKVSSNKIKIYVKGDNAQSSRLYITDGAGNPFYIEPDKFGGIDGKNVTLLAVGILIFSMFLSSDKKEDVQLTRATYNNNVMLQKMKQNKIVRINDFLKENVSNPIRSEGNRENSQPDLELTRKSA